MKKIFDPSTGRPMEILPWGSGSGSNIEKMVEHQEKYRVAALLYDRKTYKGKPCRIPEIGERAKVPVIYADSSGVRRDPGNEQIRRDYYQRIVDSIGDCSTRYGFNVDLIPLGGFMLRVSDPALSKWMFTNVHPALLHITGNGKRKYTGDKAVLNVVRERQPVTGSTVHVLTEELDGGEILVESGWMRVPYEILPDNPTERDEQGFADRVQDAQKIICDWPAYVTALKMIAAGRFSLSEEKNRAGLRTVYLDGRPLPYYGYRFADFISLSVSI